MQAVELGPFASIEDVMVDADGNPMGTGRAPGMHVSHIIKRIRASRNGKPMPAGWQEGTAGYAGFLWEVAMELAFKALGLLRPGVIKQMKLAHDETHGTMDGVDVTETPAILEEYKATWRSMKWLDIPGRGLADSLDEHFWEWMMQVKAYLKLLRVHVDPAACSVRLYILFMVGDYKGTGPRIRVVELRFSDLEIEDNWRFLMQVKADMEKPATSAPTREEVFRGFTE